MKEGLKMGDALKLVNLTKQFKNGVTAVDKLNLTVPHGSVYGFLGRNGAGKTTALKLITGLSRPTSGEVYIYDKQIEFGKPASFSRVGYLPDVPEYYSFMTAREFLFFCGRLHRMSEDEIKTRIKEIFELINFDVKRLKNKISGFSRGMKQKLGIASALLHSPDLIMLDEPTSALDPIGRKETINIIDSLRKKYTVIFSTHILTDVERICDRIALIEKGALILDGSVNEIKSRNSGLKETLRIEVLNPGDNENIEKFLRELNNIDFLSDINFEPGKGETANISLKTVDKQKAGEEIPKVIYNNNLPLFKFEFESANLEDIFVSVTAKSIKSGEV
jgi:ABC-2 type transport system ATP-binding protein